MDSGTSPETWSTVRVRHCTKGKKDVMISYNSIGSEADPAILLVQGLGCQGVHWDTEFCVKLAKKGPYRVIRFDNRCSGKSTKFHHMPVAPIWKIFLAKKLPSMLIGSNQLGPYTLKDMAMDAVALLDRLDIRSAHWVGRSMGGYITQEAALHFPTRVKSMTLIMTSSGNPASKFQPPLWVLKALVTRPKSSSVKDLTDVRVKVSKSVLHYGADFDEARVRAEETASIERSKYTIGIIRQMAAIADAPARDQALKARFSTSSAAIQTSSSGKSGFPKPLPPPPPPPVTVIHGKSDVLVPATNGHHLASLIQGSKLVLLDNMSHSMPPWHYDRYVEEINLVVGRAQNPAATTGSKL